MRLQCAAEFETNVYSYLQVNPLKKADNNEVSVGVTHSKSISAWEMVKCLFSLEWICVYVCGCDHGRDGTTKVKSALWICHNPGDNVFVANLHF